MAHPVNYIPDLNPFSLAGPPTWWLAKLWDFDNSLVVVPSRQGFIYRLAQRRKPNLSQAVVNEALFQESDTKMLASYHLVPVTTILATANWGNPYLFEELRRRAPWRLGGAEKVIREIELTEWQDEQAKKAQTQENLQSLSKDAWGLYNKKIGTRTHMWSPTVKRGGSSTVRDLLPKSQPTPDVGSIFLP
jgi:hypothetical protein